MAKESTQHKLDRVRSPRVHITYDVETDGAMQMKELPFVMGVMGDFSGNPAEPLAPLKKRKFVNIDRDNFDDVMKGMKPRLTFRVADKLTGNADSELNVQLNFSSLEDFNPANVVKQVEPMRKLLETRDKLKDLKAKMDGNDKLVELLDQVLKSTDSRDQLAKSLGVNGDPAS